MATGFFKFASRPMLWVVILSFPFLMWNSSRLKSNNETETWLPRGTQVRLDYEQFKKDFGGDEVIVVAVQPDRVDDRLIESVAARLEKVPGIARCQTPERMARKMTELGVSEEEARKRLSGLLVGKDNKLAGIIASLDHYGITHRLETVVEVNKVLDYCQLESPDICLTGGPVVVSELDRLGSPEASKKFFIAMVFICWCLLQYCMRDVRMSLSVLGVTLWSIYLTHFAIVALGGQMNFIMGSLSVMVMVFTLGIAVHVLDYYSAAREAKRPDPLGHALKESVWPCLLSTVTTLLGLLSLNVSSIKPVCDFGYAAALGAVIASAVGLILVPALIAIWPDYSAKQEHKKTLIDFHAWGGFIGRHRWGALAFGGVMMAISAGGVSLLVPRLDPVDFLPKDNLVRSDLRRIEKELTGVNSIEAIIDFGVTDTPFVKRLEQVREIQNKINEHPSVRHSLSIASFFPEVLPENPLALSGLFSKASSGAASSGLMAQEQRLWRVSVRLAEANSSAQVSEELQALVAGSSVPVKFTGISPMLGNAQSEIFTGFWESFTQAIVTIWLVLVLALRSPVVAIIAMIPNIMPILIVFGAVGYMGLPVDIGMMMTGSIALGISVDCTFHFLVFFKSALKQGKTPIEACQAALEHSGRPLIESTVISTIGMLALCLSSFTPTSRFGVLMASQMVASVLGEMVFLPALLCIFGGRWIKAVRTEEPAGNVVAAPHFATKAAANSALPERVAG